MAFKIDLHIHSIDSNSTGSNVSKESDKDKILILKKNYVKVACFSDHQKFFYTNYLARLEIIKKNKIPIVLLPGLEVNLKRFDNKIGQAVFVFSPDFDGRKLERFTMEHFLYSKKLYSYGEAVQLFKKNNFDFMVFPHAGKGADNLDIEDIKDYQVDALDATNISSSNIKKIQKVRKLPVVYFSDTHSWKKYPENTRFCTHVDIDFETMNFNSLKSAINENKLIKGEIC
ncbi:hypothetical protein [Metamycoplasma equirhinis]|uniref:hypothetical protein n=1 Tax=Metamycoplasma equirhinis TaxID=92402 RepID=UPI0035933EBC